MQTNNSEIRMQVPEKKNEGKKALSNAYKYHINNNNNNINNDKR
jgi:hypothetical protein